MAGKGATALFIPTNNGLPANRHSRKLAGEARNSDIACAMSNGMSVIRADVSGANGNLVSFGSSAIVDRNGAVLQAAPPMSEQILVAVI